MKQVLFLVATALFAPSLPSALIQSAFVSAQKGNDANPCTLASPCRTFARAIGVVAAGGQIVVLDSGDYGPMTINKSIRVQAPLGVSASVSDTTTGIVINVAPTDVVTLRGLTIKGLPPNTGTGIEFASGGSVILEHCVIDGWFDGIDVNNAGGLLLEATAIRNYLRTGITSATSSGAVAISIQQCSFENAAGGTALDIRDRTTANVRNSTFSGSVIAIQTGPAAGSSAEVNVSDCQISYSFRGIATIESGGVGTIRVANSVVTNNGFGLTQTDPNVIESQGNNMIRGNVLQDKVGNITLIAGD